MGAGISVQRFEANVAALRSLVDSGSPSVVRDAVEGSRIAGARRCDPLPSIGFRSGKLTVTGYIKGVRGGVQHLIVQCQCGRPEYTVSTHNVKKFRTQRCNLCALRAGAGTRKSYWGYSDVVGDDAHRERLLNRLSSAISRCHNPRNAQYASYGGRGITVHEAWRADRREFLRYVIRQEGWDDPTLDMDRRDNNKGYQPGNIRFISRSENARNKRSVGGMQIRLAKLEAEVARLRRTQLWPEAPVHGDDE